MSNESKNSNPALLVAAVTASCVALAEFGHLVSLPGSFATFWPNSGLMLALILWQPMGRWKWVLLGALFANLISDVCLHDKSVLVAASFWGANSLETLVAAWLFRILGGDDFALTTVRRVVQFVFLPCLIGTAFGASLGAAIICLAFGDQYFATWRIWWSGDFVGMLVVFPLVQSLLPNQQHNNGDGSRHLSRRTSRDEIILLLGLLVVHGLITAYIFGFQAERLAYVVYPTLLWLVIRFGFHGCNWGLLLTAVIMVAYTVKGHGLFGGIDDLSTRAIVIQVFLLVTSVTFLTLAAAMRERTAATGSLLEAKQQLEAYVELIGRTDGSWSWDIASGNVQFSPRYREMLGYESNDLEGFPNHVDSFSNAVHPEDRAQLWKNIQRHFDEGGVFQDEYRLELSDGSYRWFRVRANTTRGDDGTPLIMAGSTFDITDRKEVELHLSRSNTDLAQFAYVASHDLQEPLRAVSGFCQLLERRYADSLDKKGRGYIASAVEGASRMSVLIQDLLTFSQVGNDSRPFETVDLNHVISDVRKSLSTMIGEYDARIEFREDLPAVTGDRQMLTQLFQNLLSNAMKFRIPGILPQISIKNQSNGKYCEVAVQDNGVGVDPTYYDQIFTMFRRLHHRDEVSGTGIGLAICQRVVDRHRGEIRIESVETGGSRFVVKLPLQEMQDA